jgi:hypothetical protein
MSWARQLTVVSSGFVANGRAASQDPKQRAGITSYGQKLSVTGSSFSESSYGILYKDGTLVESANIYDSNLTHAKMAAP